MSVLSEPLEEGEKSFDEVRQEAIKQPDNTDAEEQASVEVKTEPEKKPEPSIEEKYNNLQAALREEREEKKRIREEVQKTQQAMQQFESLRAELEERRRQAQEEKIRQEYETNPAEYLRKQQEALAQKVDGALTAHQQTQAQIAQRQQFEAAVTSQVSAYKQTNPNYLPALEWARDRRMAEYAALGVPETQRAQLFEQESYQLAVTAFNQGRNPAEVAYQLAETWGFKPKAEEKTEDKIVRLQAGQKAAQTLSKKSAPAEESLLKKIENMDDKEFDKFWNENVKPKRAV